MLACVAVPLGLSGCGRDAASEQQPDQELSQAARSSGPLAAGPNGTQPTDEQAHGFARVERAEGHVLDLTQQIKSLSKDILNLQIPITSHGLFAGSVEVVDLASKVPQEMADQDPRVPVRIVEFGVSDATVTQDQQSLSIWDPLVSKVQFFEHAKFYIVDGDFADASELTFNTKCGFAGLAKLRDGNVAELRGRIDVQWQRQSIAEDEPWRIVQWQTKSARAAQSQRTFFTDVLGSVVPDRQTTARLSDSVQKRLIAHAIETECDCDEEIKNLYTLGHQSIAVTDINGDGWDDLFLSSCRGPCTLLENQRDGTFRDVAPALELDIEGPITASCFADFDNDGDLDAFFGKRDQPACYFENQGSSFVLKKTYDVSYVTSIASADYNQDGLLDVYLTTYDDHNRLMLAGTREQMTPDAFSESRVTNLFSLPNVLLTNQGQGTFGRQHDDDEATSIRRASYQAAWTDYDNDGDPDLYIANDFSPNVLLKNYSGKFVDVTKLTGTADVGFGMGACWGDYDNDGKQDLYVSNMYSKAGVRITDKLQGLMGETRKAARGNSLFHNDGAAFTKVSGSNQPDLLVEKAGWSWGSQFVDLNNDGFLDLHAPSGYYTPPARFQLPDDL